MILKSKRVEVIGQIVELLAQFIVNTNHQRLGMHLQSDDGLIELKIEQL